MQALGPSCSNHLRFFAASQYPNMEQRPQNVSNAQATHSRASSIFDSPFNNRYGDILGSQNQSLSVEGYEIRFGTRSPDPSSPLNQASLEFEDIVNVHALGPSERQSAPFPSNPISDQPVLNQPLGSVPLQISTHHVHFANQTISASVPHNIHSSPSFLFPGQQHYHFARDFRRGTHWCTPLSVG